MLQVHGILGMIQNPSSDVVPAECTMVTTYYALLTERGKSLFRCSLVQAQEHEFNTPLQLGDVSELEGASTAEDADTYTIELQRQDIIVMASDGVLDNLWIDDMSQIVYAVLKVVLQPLETLLSTQSRTHGFLTPDLNLQDLVTSCQMQRCGQA